ncbi:MAG: hypothetical protein JWQ71_1357 [Pedosphaera sp.]|nr:hypothetical protein [Pedosphaera sp.]
MKSAGPAKHFILAFVIAVVLYAVAYTLIEHRRTNRGPWQVSFTSDVSGTPAIAINEPKMGISNLKITFPNDQLSATNSLVIFDPPRQVPFDVPLGQCIFLDTTFQPGTVVLNLFGHEIQLIPRVLTIDKKEYPWQSESTIAVTNKPILKVPKR